MPRNPDKQRCSVPGCSNWAMRLDPAGSGGQPRPDRQAEGIPSAERLGRLCRSHSDALLGPRGAGAPRGNLNALSRGDHAQVLTPSDLRELAHQMIHRPQGLRHSYCTLFDGIHGRTQDPFRVALAFKAAFTQLIPLIADLLFQIELDQLAQLSPADRRKASKDTIWTLALPYPPEDRLRMVRILTNRVKKAKMHSSG